MDMLPVEPVDLSGGERLAMGTDELCVLASSAQTGGARHGIEPLGPVPATVR